MAYIELLIRVNRDGAEALSDALIEAGALSAAIEDADAGSEAERPLFGEPGGEPDQAAWDHSIIVALFDDQADSDAIFASACLAAGLANLPPPIRRAVADQDWVRLTQAQFDPIHVGERIWIVPSWHATPPEALGQNNAVLLQLDPGLAFGTGSHPTTRLCLAWLENHMPRGARVIDYGCGSGILAIAAKLLGAGEVVGTDIDPHAVSASIANAAVNEVDAQFAGPDEFQAAPAEIVVANILSNPLKVLAPLLCDLVAPGGSLVLSGILERQWQEVAAVYAPMIKLDLWRTDEGWVCLAGSKPAAEPDWATRCPECETIFSFSLDEISGHGGRVRCGVCSTAFNALDHARDPERFRDTPESATHFTAASDGSEATERATQRQHASAPSAEPTVSPDPIDAPASSPDSTDATPPALPPTLAETSFLRHAGAQPERPVRRWGYGLAALLLALILTLQAINLWRNELAAYVPALRTPLVAVCQWLACTVDPLAQIDALTIEATELQIASEQRPAYAFIALLRNRSGVAQRYPHIELTLADTQGNVVVRRALDPALYLSAEQLRRLADGIPANTELPVRFSFELADTRATGFRSILFYPAP